MPESIRIPATDGYILGGYQWRHPNAHQAARPVAIINAATSVRCHYYSRFAEYLYAHGWNVVTYDYRGIGESRPDTLRRFDADWIDWGEHDFEGVLQYAKSRFPGQEIDVIGHSIGGFVIGLAKSAHWVRRIFTMGAQFAYWKDYQADKRLGMFLKWHFLMPTIATVLGHVPAKRLGRLAGYPFKVDSLRQELYPEFHLLCQARKHTDHDIKRMVAELSPADIDKPVTYRSISTNRRASATRGQILLHLFNHQTHHRGQITSMLSQLGHNYGVTDLIALPETTLAA